MDYNMIMDALANLPGAIAAEEGIAAQLRMDASRLKASIADRELEIATLPGANWGTNEAARKAAKELAFKADSILGRHGSDLRLVERDLAQVEISVNRLKNQFYAARSMSDLLAASLLGGKSIGGACNQHAIADYIAPAYSAGL